ncbi:LysR family transcriptional regulator [Demequina sp. SO4-18]|uniref:LysR family transcriptional regulator n=1 Tax=Demequina sp. SO4-18 TaxID=3401026 RepID=UPI003B5C2367
MLSIQRLRTLREFAIRGTVAGAADSLGYTASAVSQQLSALERETGARLLRKSGRRLVLTTAGERLVAAADTVLNAVESAESDLRATRGEPAGSVRAAMFQSAALSLLPSALGHLREAAPKVRLQVTQSEPAQALQDTWARDYDVVIAEEYPHHSAPHYPGLRRETLISDEISLAARARSRTEDGPGARSLADHRDSVWVMEPRGTASRHFAEQTCRLAGFEPDVRYETADLQAHIALVAAGEAVSLLPGLMWMATPADIVRSTLPGTPRRTVFAAMRATTSVDPAVSAVLSALRLAAAPLGRV